MQRVKLINLKNLLFLGLFCLVFFVPRLVFLDRDEVNPDGVNWHFRSEQFIVALKARDFVKTYQHYHPGVTLTWIMGPVVEIIKRTSDFNFYDQFSFPVFHFYSKLALVSCHLALTLLAMYQLSWLTNKKIAYTSMLLLSIEPFFLGNSRILHMDVLLALVLFNALLFSFSNLKKYSVETSVITGFFLSLSFLTKSIAVVSLPFIILMWFLGRKDWRIFLKACGITILSFALFTFMFFPALWVEPVQTLVSIFSEAERVGVRKGHDQIVLGELRQDAGSFFYPLVILMKVSPVTLVGFLVYLFVSLFKALKSKTCPFKMLKNINIYLYLGVFYLGYFMFMFFPSKKIDRYMLVIYPFLCLISIKGLVFFIDKFKDKTKYVVLAIMSLVFSYQLYSFFPYYFTYTSPIFGSAEQANKIIAQKPFGIGMFELRDTLVSRYGQPIVGFYDTKPIRAIYSNSKTYDVRINGPGSYDLFVLGPNEEIPEKVLEGDYVFEKDYSLYINGLEYWRIYVKKV